MLCLSPLTGGVNRTKFTGGSCRGALQTYLYKSCRFGKFLLLKTFLLDPCSQLSARPVIVIR